MAARVLLVPSWYAHPAEPVLGVFIRNQALALNISGLRADVSYLEPRSLRSLSLAALLESHFQVVQEQDGPILTLRQKGWNPALNSVLGGIAWARLSARLIANYVHRFGKPDVLHAHCTFWAGYAAFLASKRLDIPFVVTEHSSTFLIPEDAPSPAMARIAAKVLTAAKDVVAVSSTLAREVERWADRPVTVIPNTVDTDFFTLPPHGRPPGACHVLAVGGLAPNKGFLHLVEAFARAFGDRPEARLTIVGQGPQRTELEARAQDLEIAGRVRFPGALSQASVRDLLWDANLLVSTSLRETFGMTLIEAMATGLPVVATRSGGPEDILNKEVGALAAPGDPEDLAAKLRAWSTGPLLDPAAIRDQAISRYGHARIAQRLAELYNT